MRATTTKLRLTFAHHWQIHERHIRDGAFCAAMIVALLLIHSLLRPAPVPTVPLVMRGDIRPAILIATATLAPPQPTATAIVEYVYIALPTMPPVVEYVEVYVEAAPAAPQQPEAPPAAIEAVPPPPEAPQDGGGGGRMTAPVFEPMQPGDWCSAAAAAGHAHCAGE